ncbi:MAG TPA: hypothetical protein VF320_11500, partial [Acidimicrobiales bacterium]
AALLGRTLAERGVVARIGSAGLVSEGQPATADAQAAMSARGLDLSAHRSRLLDVEKVSSADLVLAMARQHLREAVVRRPDRYSRTFTLKELVRRGAEVGPRDPDEPLEAWLARAHSGRAPASQLGVSPLDDVEDPVGRGPDVYRETAGELDSLTTLLADLLWRQVPSTARS